MASTLIDGYLVPAPTAKVDLATAISALHDTKAGDWLVLTQLGQQIAVAARHVKMVARFAEKNYVESGLSGDKDARVWINPAPILWMRRRGLRLTAYTNSGTQVYGAVIPQLVKARGFTEITSKLWVRLAEARFFYEEGTIEIGAGNAIEIGKHLIPGITATLVRDGWLSLSAGRLVNPAKFVLRDKWSVTLDDGTKLTDRLFTPESRATLDKAVNWTVDRDSGKRMNPSQAVVASALLSAHPELALARLKYAA